jgi:hypothetical protein
VSRTFCVRIPSEWGRPGVQRTQQLRVYTYLLQGPPTYSWACQLSPSMARASSALTQVGLIKRIRLCLITPTLHQQRIDAAPVHTNITTVSTLA